MAETTREGITSDTPVLKVVQVRGQGSIQTKVQIETPQMPGSLTEIWCYEDQLRHGEHFQAAGGEIVLLHQHPGGAQVVTRVVPSPGVVDWYVTVTGPTVESVRAVTKANGCWQFKSASGFRSDEGSYVDSFVSRCFIHTEKGFTRMTDTDRKMNSKLPLDDPNNNPPVVQRYYAEWANKPDRSAGWGSSDDRFTHSIVGAVSRDGRHLMAWGGCRSDDIGQGWHDCLHLGSELILDYDAETNRIETHSRMYFMENDPEGLIERYKKDFEGESTEADVMRPASAKSSSALPRFGSEAPGSQWIVRGIGMEMVWIPDLGIWVGRHEITNQNFRMFRPDHDSGSLQGYSLNDDYRPAVEITAQAAIEFCKWLTEREKTAGRLPEGYRFRLPKTDEWTAIARSGRDRDYPWGDTMPPTSGNYADLAAQQAFPEWTGISHYSDGHVVTAPVALSGRNEWGLFGVGGNVLEWTTPSQKGRAVPRGGCWLTGHTSAWWVRVDTETQLRADYTGFTVPSDFSSPATGFRCVLARDL